MSLVKRKLTSFALYFIDETISDSDALDMMRGYLLKRLKNLSAQQAAYAITNNVNLWHELPPRFVNLLSRFAKHKRTKLMYARFSELITPQEVMKWFIDERNDVASVIINMPEQRGTQWLERQVSLLKAEFERTMA